jgi:large subunit ribosomal protein L35
MLAAQHFTTTARSRDVEPSTTTTSTTSPADVEAILTAKQPSPTPSDAPEWSLDPNVTTLPWAEEQLLKAGTPPIGSRRRRAAVRTSGDVPFEQLPYQCFQEARKLLNADREKKLAQILATTNKIAEVEALDSSKIKGGEAIKQLRLKGLRKHLNELKILADINDPLVKRRFEDGIGELPFSCTFLLTTS